VFGGAGTIISVGGGFIMFWCRTLPCTTVQELTQIIGDLLFIVPFVWLMFVTFGKKSVVTKQLERSDSMKSEKEQKEPEKKQQEQQQQTTEEANK
jgi:hypothetical protein